MLTKARESKDHVLGIDLQEIVHVWPVKCVLRGICDQINSSPMDGQGMMSRMGCLAGRERVELERGDEAAVVCSGQCCGCAEG